MPSTLIILATGSEEMEVVIVADVLRRGGVDVTIGGLDGVDPVTCSRGVVIVPDKALVNVKDSSFDAVYVPGGLKGSENIAKSSLAGEILKAQECRGGVVTAICAGPTAFISHQIAKGKQVTAHPAVKDKMVQAGYSYSSDRVVVDGQVITSQGPGTAMELGLALVRQLVSPEKEAQVQPELLMK